MTVVRTDSMLRRVLWLDAGTCLATSLGLLALGGLLEAWLAIPAGLSRGAGAFLLLFAAEVAWLARHEDVPRNAVRAIVAANVLWVIASAAALVTGWLAPNPFGSAFVVAQAVAVAVIAALQVIGLKRMLPAGAA